MNSPYDGTLLRSLLGMDRDDHVLCPVCNHTCAEPAAVDIHLDPWRMTCLGDLTLFDGLVPSFYRRDPELSVWYRCDLDHHFVVRYQLSKGSIQVEKRDNSPVN
jgi:hypothetical protein